MKRTRTLWVSTLDRQLAQSEAVGRVVRSGFRPIGILSAERILDPDSSHNVWEIVVRVSRARHR
jgi:hypothetical protein